MALARFVTLHQVPEGDHGETGTARFSVTLARAPEGITLVYSRYRKVWELPGGLIDPGETARACAAREFREETGGAAGDLQWLGLVEVFDGQTHFGGVYSAVAESLPRDFQNEETGGLARSALYLADMFEQRLDTTTQRLVTVLEPVIIVTVSIVVAAIVVSIMGAVVSVYDFAL